MSVVIQEEEEALSGRNESLASASHPQTSKAGLRKKKCCAATGGKGKKTHEIFGLPPFARPFFSQDRQASRETGEDFLNQKVYLNDITLVWIFQRFGRLIISKEGRSETNDGVAASELGPTGCLAQCYTVSDGAKASDPRAECVEDVTENTWRSPTSMRSMVAYLDGSSAARFDRR